MPIFELYSARQEKASRGTEPDVYQYHDASERLRTQVSQILSDALGTFSDSEWGNSYNNNDTWTELSRILRKEKGLDYLTHGDPDQHKEEVLGFLRNGTTDDFLDVVHVCAFHLNRIGKRYTDHDRRQRGIRQEAGDALEEINYRFRGAGFGFSVEGGEIVRVDSQFLHSEVVKPALLVLRDPRFKGAEDEFLAAHKAYRERNLADAITGANRAFESAMKAVCDLKGWQYAKGARSSDLIKTLRQNGLLPDYLDGSFDQLIATLASGLPKVRDNVGAHGQGGVPRQTPDYIASYALHLAATKIVLLADAALAEDAKDGTR